MNDTYQLLYTSFIAPDIDANGIRTIVDRARDKNAVAGLTGLLVFDGLCFCHYLEGPSDALYALLGVVRFDRRHFNFRLKEHAPLSGPRLFPSSPLAYASSPDPEALDHIVKLDPSAGVSAIQQFKNLLNSLQIE